MTNNKHPHLAARVRAAVKAADHLGPEHAGAVRLAEALAASIDSAFEDDSGGPAYRKFLGWCAPNLTGVLRSLGLTVDAKTGNPARPIGPNALDRLRAQRTAG